MVQGARSGLLDVRLMEGCAPSMGANLWGASPLWEYRLGLIVSKDNHEPKARAKPRGIVRVGAGANVHQIGRFENAAGQGLATAPTIGRLRLNRRATGGSPTSSE